MAGRLPEEHVSSPTLAQDWRDMTFLHWRYEPEVVAALLPEPLRPDVYDGSAWVGLTSFRVERFRLAPLPAVPGVSSFPETNLRTYVVGPDGRDGLWFLALEADSAWTTGVARLALGVPYHWAAMQVAWEAGRLRYTSRRRLHGGPPVGHDITVEPGAPFAPEELTEFDHWLTGRWRSWTRVAGRLADVPTEHEPWPLRRVEVLGLEESLFASVGLPRPDEAPVAHYSPGVHAKLGRPRL